MNFDEILYGFNNLFFGLGWTLCYPHREVVKFLGVSPEPFVVAKEEHKQGGYGNSLVSILKGVILDHEIEKNTSLDNQRWVQ